MVRSDVGPRWLDLFPGVLGQGCPKWPRGQRGAPPNALLTDRTSRTIRRRAARHGPSLGGELRALSEICDAGCSTAVQYASAEQIEVGPAEPHPLEELDARDVSLDLAGTPWAAQGGGDGVEVAGVGR